MLKDKRQKIVDAAIKRFIYFGVAKTTMDDIAKDLSLSKPSLYYYFVNKNHLVGAVLDDIFDEYFQVLSAFSLNQTLEEILNRSISVQWEFFKRYYLLGITGGLFFNLKDKILQEKLVGFRSKNLGFLINVFNLSKQRMQIDHLSVDVLANLYLQCLEGMAVNLIFDGKISLPFNQDQYQRVYQNALEFTAIFVKGIGSIEIDV